MAGLTRAQILYILPPLRRHIRCMLGWDAGWSRHRQGGDEHCLQWRFIVICLSAIQYVAASDWMLRQENTVCSVQ